MITKPAARAGGPLPVLAATTRSRVRSPLRGLMAPTPGPPPLGEGRGLRTAENAENAQNDPYPQKILAALASLR